MENQHRKIKGYRELSEQEIANMNKVKEIGIKIGGLVEELRTTTHKGVAGLDMITHDHRWVNIGAADLQKGLMALTRSIAKPDFF